MAFARRARKPTWKKRTIRKGGPRRGYRRRRYASRGKVLSKLGFPTSMFVRLRYVSLDIPVTFAASADPLLYTYRANGAYDPVYSVGGGQPRFYDTLLGADGGSAPYMYYTVTGCKVQATLQTENGIPAHLCVGFRESASSAPSTGKQAMESTGYSTVSVSNDTGGPAVKVLQKYRSMASIFGCSKKSVIGDPDLTGDYNTTPSKEALADVLVWPVAITNSTYYLTIKVTYYMKVWGLNNVTDS